MTPSKVWQALKEESSVLFAAMTIRVRSQAVWLPGFIYPQITEIWFVNEQNNSTWSLCSSFYKLRLSKFVQSDFKLNNISLVVSAASEFSSFIVFSVEPAR